MNENIKETSSKEINSRVEFLSTVKCNHTPHMYIDIAGGLIEGTLLSRILYWFSADKNGKSKVRIYRDGHYWIAKQRKDWQEEVRITERQYDRAIKVLSQKKLVNLAKYKFDSMPTVHIRPNWDVIDEEVKAWKENLKKEVIEECELQNEEIRNDTNCNSQGNDEKCNSGVAKKVIPLTFTTDNNYNNNNDYIKENTEKDFIIDNNKEKETSSAKADKESKTSAPTKEHSISIPPRTKEQRDSRRNKRNRPSLLEYKDEDVQAIISSMYNDLYGSRVNILEDHDICLAIMLITEFFKKYQKRRGERHSMINREQAEKILETIRNPETDMMTEDWVEEEDEPQFYLDMMDEHFSTDWGKNNKAEFDYQIMLFFGIRTQNILYQRVKQKWERQNDD